MSTILDLRFNSDLDGFDVGTRDANTSAILGDASGVLRIGSGITATRTFTGITTGAARLDIWYLATDTTAADAGNTSNYNHNIYLMPASGSVISANSCAFVALSRNASVSATTTTYAIVYRNGASFTTLAPLMRKNSAGQWVKISFVLNISARTYDLYVCDTLVAAAVTCPNSTFIDFTRVVLTGGSSAPDAWFDNVLLQDAYSAPSESLLIDDDFTTGSGALSASTPSTSLREQSPQSWVAPTKTASYGGFTRGASGLTPDASLKCIGLVRCGAEGQFECTWTAASSGTIYMGMVLRVWGGPGTDAYYLLRYNGAGSAGTQLTLFSSTTSIAASAGTAGGVTYSAGGTYTLKVIARGRLLYCYVNNQLQFGGPITTTTRGLLCEEHAGPFHDSAIGSTNNKCTRFKWTGRVPSLSTTKTIGSNKWNVEIGSIKEWYRTDSGGSTENLFWSRGIQFCHRAEHDMGEDFSAQQSTVCDSTNVAVYYQQGNLMSEYGQLGYGTGYVTLLRRGPWVDDSIVAFGTSQNFAPDHDLRPARWYGNNARYINATGASSSYSFTPEHDWTLVTSSAVSLPLGLQTLASFGSGNNARLTIVARSNTNMADAAHNLLNKFVGDASPISTVFQRNVASMVDGTQYRMGRGYLIESGSSLALSDTVLTGWRDDIKTPATMTASIGSANTGASGDYDADGFNERHGWYEYTCSGGVASFTLAVGGITRYMPAFRLSSWGGGTVVLINGGVGVSGTDYVLDDLGGGVALLQILSSLASDTTVSLFGATTTEFALFGTEGVYIA